MPEIYIQYGRYSVFVFEQSESRRMLEYFDQGRTDLATAYCEKLGITHPEIRDCPYDWR